MGRRTESIEKSNQSSSFVLRVEGKNRNVVDDDSVLSGEEAGVSDAHGCIEREKRTNSEARVM